MFSLFLFLFMMGDGGSLEERLLQNNCDALVDLLDEHERIRIDFRPLLREHGRFPKHQAELALCKLLKRYNIDMVESVQSLYDTNYSWLVQHYKLSLKDKKSGRVYHISLSVNSAFKKSSRYINEILLSGVS